MNTLECPTCRKGLSLWQFAKAPTPFHLKCGSCGEKLRLAKHGGLITAFAFGTGIAAGASLAPFGIAIFISGVIGVALVFEVVLYSIAALSGLKLARRGNED